MVKSVLKEIIIILLLSIAILLILMVLFYEYIPMSKIIPDRAEYVTPNEVQEELAEEVTENNAVPITYSITDADLNIYKQSGTTVEGKSNPFALEESTTTTQNNQNGGTENNSSNNNSANNNSSTNENTNVDRNSTGTFFNEEGIK